MDGESSNNPTESVLAGLGRLVDEAKAGNPDALPELRGILDEFPEIWRHYGDLAKHTENKWIDLIAGDDACLRESVQRTCTELRTKLIEAGDSPLERLLIDRIIVSQLMVSFFDCAVAVAIDAPESRTRFLHQQLDRAQKRHIEAMKALTEVRKLLP
jgi:hypothetical protein